jgi:hypothetical protein
VGGRVEATIDPNGLVTSVVLVPNDAITPSGTYYLVQISTTGPVRTSWTERWSVTTSPDPVDVGDITRLDTPSDLVSMEVQQDNVRKVSQPNSLDFENHFSVTASGNEARVDVDLTKTWDFEDLAYRIHGNLDPTK